MGVIERGRGDALEASVTRPEASFGARLRAFRERAGLSQQALADRAGLGITTLAALERGQRRRPHPDTVARLCKALGLAADEQAILFELVSSGPVSQPTPNPPQLARGPAASERIVRLPRPLTPLLGRQAEMAELRQLLAPTAGLAHLVTLIGPAGVGKTRLAQAVGAELLDVYRDGVVFVDLAPLHDPRLVPATIARTLDVHESGGGSARELLLATLAARQLLLILDNFEQLHGAARFVAEVLQACGEIAILATSRVVLRLRAERLFPVEPLPTPAEDDELSLAVVAQSPAVRLFVERAQKVAPGFVLEPRTAPAVAALCRRLEGLPLAIELAAARASLLGPDALLRRLEYRLPVLSVGAVDLPVRQQTLRNALTWSHQLLRPAERVLLRRLAIFVGGWTLAAAEVVCADAVMSPEGVLDDMQVLVDSSLVRRHVEHGGDPRFRMLETVHEYALEHLAESQEIEALGGRHAAYFLALVEEAEKYLRGPDQRAWFDCLEVELVDLRAALEWSVSAGDLDLGLRLATGLASFWKERGHMREGREWLDRLLIGIGEQDNPSRLAPLQARALAANGWLTFLLGDFEAAAPLAERSLALWQALGLAGNSHVALCTLGFVARHAGDLARQDALFTEALAVCRAQDDNPAIADVLGAMGPQRRASGDLASAYELLQEALRLHQATGDIDGIAHVLLHLGGVAAARKQTSEARALFEQSLALSESKGDHTGVAFACGGLAGLAADAGDYPHARKLCERAAATFRRTGDGRGLTEELRLLGRIAAAQGDHWGAAAAYTECLRHSNALRMADLAFALEGLASAIVHTTSQRTRLEVAVWLLGAAAAFREGLTAEDVGSESVSQLRVTHHDYLVKLAKAQAALDPATFESAWCAGRALSREQAVAAAIRVVR
ncbi:MAG TPA: helix-turn-helix domain-containing protein [Chloroflexota bacterium]